MYGKRHHSEIIWNIAKFCKDWKVWFKYLKALTANFVKGFNKSLHKFHSFSKDEIEGNKGLILCSKGPFCIATILIEKIFNKMFWQFSRIRQFATKFCDILQSFTTFYGHQQNSTIFNGNKQQICQNIFISWFQFHNSLLVSNFFNSIKIKWFQTHNTKAVLKGEDVYIKVT
jgi:hypothetical protein